MTTAKRKKKKREALKYPSLKILKMSLNRKPSRPALFWRECEGALEDKEEEKDRVGAPFKKLLFGWCACCGWPERRRRDYWALAGLHVPENGLQARIYPAHEGGLWFRPISCRPDASLHFLQANSCNSNPLTTSLIKVSHFKYNSTSINVNSFFWWDSFLELKWICGKI